MSTESRERLAREQADLLQALLRDGRCPAGIEDEHFDAAALSLRQKRERTVAKVWPSIATALGSDFSDQFGEYAKHHDLPAAGAVADAKLFIHYLAKHDLLPDSLLQEFFSLDGWRRHYIWCAILKRILRWRRMNCLMRSLCPLMRI